MEILTDSCRLPPYPLFLDRPHSVHLWQFDVWTPRESVRDWAGVVSSRDGQKLVAVVFGGQIYTSNNTGADWTARESDRLWIAVASSDDGQKLVAVESGGKIYTSGDGGATWTARSLTGPGLAWRHRAMGRGWWPWRRASRSTRRAMRV